MSRPLAAPLAFVFLAAGGQALAAPLPAPVEAMIEAVAGDPAKLSVVAGVARETNPDSVAEIDAMVAVIREEAERERIDRLSSYTLVEGWKGQGEAGGSVSTGNTDQSGLTIGLDLNRETLFRRHRVNAVVDRKTANGVRTAQRYFAGYQGDYKIGDRFYANLLASWERDPFAGLADRLSESAGLGYRLLPDGDMRLDVDLGVAARQTRYLEKDDEATIGGRAGARYEWRMGPQTKLTQVASAYVDSQTNTLESATALTTRLAGDLSWRASFNIRHESAPPEPRDPTDTTTRFSLVYAF